jgi:hypothetical protein
VCTDIIENIDPLLLTSTITLGISDQATIHDSINVNEGKRDLLKVEFSGKGEAVI